MRKLGCGGFTLTEMMLVVGIITAIMAVGTPLFMSLNNSNQMEAAMNILVQDLYQAQTYSRSQNQDSQWGVAVVGQRVTLFSGASYATRNTAQDIIYSVPTSVTLAGSTEVVYSKLYGLPQTAATFNVSGGGRSGSVVVNSKGMVEY